MDLGLLIAVTSTFGVLFGVERRRPARSMPSPPRWRVRGLVAFVLIGAFGTQLVPLLAHALSDESSAAAAPLAHLSGGLAAFIAASLPHYALHRWQHVSPLLWRACHRHHHAPPRVDLLGAFVLHPLDLLTWLGPLAALVALAALPPPAASVAVYLAFVARVVPHLDTRTPPWLGRLVQRPEAHSLHHGRDLHAYNYGDLSLWDQLFGTFRNPSDFNEKLGIAPSPGAAPTTHGDAP